MINTKAKFLKAAQRKTIQVEFPGSKEKITLQELTLAQRLQIVDAQRQEKPTMEVLALAVALSADFLTEKDVPDIVDQCSEKALQSLSSAVIELNGMAPESVEEAEKNSESGQS